MMRLVATLAAATALFAGGASAQQIERYTQPSLPDDLPFASAVRAGDTVYLSGAIGRDRERNVLVEGGIAAQTTQALENMAVSLELAGGALSDIVKCTVFLTDMSLFDEMNAAYAAFFESDFPARTSAGVNELAWGALVEIECIAWLPRNDGGS